MENRNVDIIIPSYKPDEKLNRLLLMLNQQTIKPRHIFLINTEKQYIDETMYNKINNLSIIHIKKVEFDHGGTRNFGASLSKADIIVFMTQDAVPVNGRLLEELIKPFYRTKVAVSYGRQLPRKDAGEIENFTRTFNYPDTDRIKSLKDLPVLGIKTYFCSDVCAAYKKDIYVKMGGFITHTIFNEDMIMAAKLIKGGYEVAYASKAEVEHSHKYTYKQQFKRNFDLAVSQKEHKEVFAGVKSESEGMKLVKMTMCHLIKKRKLYLIPDLILQSGFKYLGFKAGSNFEKLPRKLIRKWSMSPSYWLDK